ncbi:hypothetical protein WN48_11019 [Eufriesea mexicana]|uniref:Uncharacterized protein n=1 Tax=Eufriesea mexicana TaxID=516756 RepID=A0A310S8N6_9HYME|nr:hypothetical protein WN48_11019 [Eufriesea mexicana]
MIQEKKTIILSEYNLFLHEESKKNFSTGFHVLRNIKGEYKDKLSQFELQMTIK